MYEVAVTDTPDQTSFKIIMDGIGAFNTANAGPLDIRPLIALAKSATEGVVGGLIGWTSYRWLYIEALWLPERMRKGGIGTEVLRRAEAEAVVRGCIGSWLYTASFQARGFYERVGYSLFGKLADCPPGHETFFMTKRLL
jgi:GNAT superfamily N-acetyltransferase